MKLKNHYRITCNYAKSIIRMESVKPKGKRLSHKKKTQYGLEQWEAAQYYFAGWSKSNTYKIKWHKQLPIFPGILLFTGGSKGAPWWHTANELTLGVFVSTNIKRTTSLHIIGTLLAMGWISNVVFLLHEYTQILCTLNRGNVWKAAH